MAQIVGEVRVGSIESERAFDYISRHMIRVLHLCDVAFDYQTERGIAQLRQEAGGTFTSIVQTIGRGGTHPDVPRGALSLRRAGESPDLVHAWGMPGLATAALSSGGPIIFSPTRHPGAMDVRWLRAVCSHRNVQIACPTDTCRRALVEHGVAMERCHLIRPGVEFSRVKRKRDDELRRAMGFMPEDRVTLAVGESTRASDHRLAAWTAVILFVLDRRNRLLIWGRGELADNVHRFADRLEQPGFLVSAEYTLARAVEFEELLNVADEVLVTATDPVPTLPIATCMAAGIPIVGVVSETVAELLEDRHTALLSPAGSARKLAQRVLDLRDDSRLAWSIADMARTEAFEFFAHTRFVHQFRSLYSQVAANGVATIEQPEPGPGLRFHSRGASGAT
ncbi:MAG: glycosyltransferase [Tepidisphaeraceae bacterium]